ncbi:MAG: PQQ-dependent sugar dehydrogenase [Acidimicrobiia bacterium]|nr:PQQ-dependent sugar dehydrogenase [Acidimicrobiia bacterium]
MSMPAETLAGDWLPDGRLLTITRPGQVTLVDPVAATSTVVLTMNDVGTRGNRGAPDLELHPDFENNAQFFVYHLTAAEPAALKIVRFTLDENSSTNTANSIQQVWENPGPDHSQDFHIGGSLDISGDGKLLLTIGDGLISAQAATLDNVFGKVIRLNLDGSPASDNPWFNDGDGDTLADIWAYGLRNPFRAHVDPVTGIHWVADVGGNVASEAYEEVNQIVEGGNYGWPACEGPLVKQGAQQGADCPAGVAGPWHYYDHFDVGRSITGGEVYRGTAMPVEMRGSYIFTDYIKDVMTWVEVNVDGSAGTVNEIDMIASSRPVWVSVGPDGWIYYLRYHPTGGPIYELRRLRYTGVVDQPPVVNSISAIPEVAMLGEAIAFLADVEDPDLDPISYEWDFGDGSSSTDAAPSHNYGAPGPYSVSLTITANGAQATSAPLNVFVVPSECNGLTPTIDLNVTPGAVATGGADVILGTPGADVISGLGGGDTICGLGGDDTIAGNGGDDTILGGDGADTIYGGPDADTIRGGAGDDIIQGNGGVDVLNGDAGEDTLSGNDGDDTLNGGPDNDTLYGVAGVDTINGDGGADTILGGLDDDIINGGDGDDLISGNAGADIINGDADNDTLYGSTEGDTINGGPGLDIILGGTGDDVIDGGPDRDLISGNENDDTINGGAGNDDIFGVDGADTLNGDGGIDLILGGNGDDIINGGTENDLLSGNANNDTIDGGDGDDEIYGVTGDDILTGGAGLDIILGGPNDDTINSDGDSEVDQVSGNAGVDTCNADTGPGVIDAVFQCELP